MVRYVLILFLFLGLNAFAEEASFSLRGQVVDAEILEPLPGATVQVIELAKGTFTDAKGRFHISNLKPSKYSIKVSYLGYKSEILENVDIGNNNDLVVYLYPEIKSTKEITVEATRINDNEAAMLTMKKGAGNLVDGITISEIKKLPDNSLTSALKRISGVSMFNDFVIVRGMGERYSLATLNGTTLPSTETDRKSFSFDLFPSDFVENVSLVKSFTPDLPGTFAGGLVQLNTVDFPATRSFKLSISSKANSVTTFKRNSFVGYTGGSLDWLGVDDGTRKLPSDFPASRRALNELMILANNPFDTTGALQKFENIAKSFNSKTLQQKKKTVTPLDNKSLNLEFANTYELDGYLIGLTANGLYSSNFKINSIQRNTYLSSFDTMYTTAGGKSVVEINSGGLVNLSLKTPNNQLFSLKTSLINNSEDEVLLLDGKDLGYQFLEFKNISMHYIQKTLFNTTLTGNNIIMPINLKVNWNAGYSKLNRSEPDYRRFRFSRLIADAESDPQTPFVLELLPNQQGDGTRAGRFFANLFEESISFGVNLERNFVNLLVKMGGLFDRKQRSFNARSITITMSPYLRDDIYSLLSNYENIDKILAPENFSYSDGLRIGEDSKLSDSYNASELLVAGYFMIDYREKLFDLPFRVITGLRVEKDRIVLSSYNINDEPVKVNYPTFDLLPAISLILMPTNNSNIRFNFSRTLARPSFREFAPFAFYDYYEMALVQGNPNLKRARIANFDLRYEIFPNYDELFSIGLFYKTFENAIEETIFPQQSELTRTFANANGIAKNLGVEFEMRKNLGFLWEHLTNVSLISNVALINSTVSVNQGGTGTEDKRQMWGQSPYTVNIGLFYQNQNTGTLLSLTYNTFGRRIVRVSQVGVYQTDDPHIYELPQHYVDLLFAQRVGSVEFKLGVSNLLNAKTIYQQNGKNWSVNKYGTTVSLSISYSIF